MTSALLRSEVGLGHHTHEVLQIVHHEYGGDVVRRQQADDLAT
ncbi:hypothetical protein [Streptomyces sp. NPDC050121]